MRPLQAVEQAENLYVLEVLGVPADQRESALEELRLRCYAKAIASGISHRNAKRRAEHAERITRELVEMLQLRL
jgi:hypothetical protein